MKAPATTADLNILFVRDEGHRIVIGPRMGAGGFRHDDLLTELKFVKLWLENRTNVEQVLIDITQNEYLRGRTVAGLLMLKDHIPEGAEFAVCGESQLLNAVLSTMQATASVPVFENTQSAFLPPPRWPIRAKLKQFRSGLAARRTALLRVAAALGVAVALAALVPLVPSSNEWDYDRLLSTWEELQSLRADKPGSPELADFQQTSRQSIAEVASGHRTISQRTPQQELLLRAADALYENLSSAGVDEDSETEFMQAMQAIAGELEITELPSSSKHRTPQRRSMVH